MWNFRSARIEEPLQVFHLRFFPLEAPWQQEAELCPQAGQWHSRRQCGGAEVLGHFWQTSMDISFAAAHLPTSSSQVLVEKTHSMPDKKKQLGFSDISKCYQEFISLDSALQVAHYIEYEIRNAWWGLSTCPATPPK